VFDVHGDPGANGQCHALYGGINCFGCSTTHTLPSPDGGLEAYYADDFDSFEAGTQRTDDPMA
jgi:hypothetical protein